MFLRKALVIQKLEEAEVKKFVGHRFPEFSFSRIEELGKTENDYTNTGIINYAKIIFRVIVFRLCEHGKFHYRALSNQ